MAQTTINKYNFNPWSKIICLCLVGIFYVACEGKKDNTTTHKITEIATKSVGLIYKEALPIENLNDASVTNQKFFSGSKSIYISPEIEFSNSIKCQFSKLLNYKNIDSLEIKLMYLSTHQLKDIKVVWSIDNNEGKNLFWSGSLIENKTINSWNSLQLNFKLDPNLLNEKNSITIYVWNQKKEEIYLDDFEFSLFGKIDSQPVNQHLNSNYCFDFETNEGLLRSEKIGTTKARSGKLACDLSDGAEYGIGVKKYFKDFGNQLIKKLSASVWVYPTEKNHDLVLTFSSVDEKTGKVKFWQGKSTLNGDFPINQWSILNSAVNLPVEIFNLNDEIEVGIWNKGKTAVICDDLKIVYGAQNEKLSLLDLNTERAPNEMNVGRISPLAQKTLSYDQTSTSMLADYEYNDRLLSANFYAQNKSLDCILHLKKQNAKMWIYNHVNKAFDMIWETKDKNNFILNPNMHVSAGDFDGDGKGDLLLIDKINLTWNLYSFESKDWVLKIKGEEAFPAYWMDEKNKVSIIHQTDKKKKSVMIDFTKSEITMLYFELGKWISSSYLKGNNSISLNTEDVIMDWNENNYLKFNSNWRFDLKEIQLNNSALKELYRADFRKNALGCNPKYYEYTFLLSGHFVSPKNNHLLVGYFNCIENNGKTCSKFEKNKELPNGISFYY